MLCNIFHQYSHLNHFCSHHLSVRQFGNFTSAREFAHSQLALNYTMRRRLHNDAPHSAKLLPDRDARNCGTAGGEVLLCTRTDATFHELLVSVRMEYYIHNLTRNNFFLGLGKRAIIFSQIS